MVAKNPEITLKPSLLAWARERSALTVEDLAKKLSVKPSAVNEWERTGQIRIRKAATLARKTHTPLGYLYLQEPPKELLPITDFRTRSGVSPEGPSPELLETVYQMQRRQMWMAEELAFQGASPLEFVGGQSLDSSPQHIAWAIAETLGLAEGWAATKGTWTDALSTLKQYAEDIGVMVVSNGVVGNDTHRILDVDEFQGFSLVDEFAPLIFLNNADFKTAQIFTLAHELAHIFTGQQGLSRIKKLDASDNHIEKLCDEIAAEFLVPRERFQEHWRAAQNRDDPYYFMAKQYKVSAIVIARRARDENIISQTQFSDYVDEYGPRDWRGKPIKKSRGDSWNNQRGRIGRSFASAVLRAVGDGRLSYTEAYRLTGLKGGTFERMAVNLGLAV